MMKGMGMRSWLIVSLLVLVGCSDFRVATAHYGLGNSGYDQYRTAREQALVTGEDYPTVIPVALPVRSLTPDEIAGRNKAAQSAAVRKARPVQTQAYVPPAPPPATGVLQP